MLADRLRRQRRLSWLVGLLCLLVLTWLGLAAWSRHALGRARARWEVRAGTFEQLLADYPDRARDDAAVRLSALAAPLGVSLGGDAARGVVAGGPPQELSSWLDAQLASARLAIDPPPPETSAYLERNEARLDDVIAALLDRSVPRWRRRLSDVGVREPPLPPLVGHDVLGRVLCAEALARAGRGDTGGAERAALAAWRLADSAGDGSPLLISQLVAGSIRERVAATLRFAPVEPGEWLARLRDRSSLRDAIRLEGHWPSELLARGGDPLITLLPNGVVGWPGVRDVLRPWTRLSVAAHLATTRRALGAVVASSCRTVGPIGRTTWRPWIDALEKELSLSWSSIHGRRVRAAREIELSRQVLRARLAAERGEVGVTTVRSDDCTRWTWRRAVGRDGSFSLTWTGEAGSGGDDRPLDAVSP